MVILFISNRNRIAKDCIHMIPSPQNRKSLYNVLKNQPTSLFFKFFLAIFFHFLFLF